MKEKIKENKDKVKVNKTLPYLVANVIELLDVDGEDQEEDGANVDLDAQVNHHFTGHHLHRHNYRERERRQL